MVFSLQTTEETFSFRAQPGDPLFELGDALLEATDVGRCEPGFFPIDVVAHRGITLGIVIDGAVVFELGGHHRYLLLESGDVLVESEQPAVDTFHATPILVTPTSYVRLMRPESEYREALRLIELGVNDCEIGRRLGIPRGTIRDWRVAAKSGGRTKHWSGLRPVTCFRCEGDSVDEEAYAYLLGAYLGDGCISLMRRGVFSLRVTCDLKYPDIINEIATHIVIVRGAEVVGFVLAKGCVNVSSTWKHWPCVFPQHGPGRKHEREIKLTEWQLQMVETHPKALIRGLIHTDGTRHVNEVPRRLSAGIKRYRYPRYQFTNYSSDIRLIFTDALDLLDVHWTVTSERNISIARRKDVAFLDTFVGPKS